MSGAHNHTLYRHGVSKVHRLPAHVKIVAALTFTIVVVATPREQIWAFVAYAVLAATAIIAAGLRPAHIVKHLAIELPFVFFALLLPFVSRGPEISIVGIGLSQTGMWDAWNILAKATLGTTVSLVLASTTSGNELLRGLERLGAPALFVQIMSFMLRYVEVTSRELDRMRVAQASRGLRGNGVRRWRVLSHVVGSLFIRTYERGERVHLAMLSRGYRGSMPAQSAASVPVSTWAYAFALPALAAACAATAWTTPWT